VPLIYNLYLTKLSLPGNNLFPPWESLVSDIPGTGNSLAFFTVPFTNGLFQTFVPLLYFMLWEVLGPYALAACIGQLYWPLVLAPYALAACIGRLYYTVKKVSDFPVPAGISLTKLSLPGNNLFPAKESLVHVIPAGSGKIAKLFFPV
jgi:hypothetical protein